MLKTIVSLGEQYVFAGNVKNIPYNSSASLLDGDIILLAPDLSPYRSYARETFRGLECLDDDSSFRLKKDTEHWRAEMATALAAGKTVIVWLLKTPVVSVATGERTYSGTGRNARTTRIVTEFDPYSVVPGKIGTVVRRGGELIKASQDLGIIASYWREFGSSSRFEAYLDNFKGDTLLETQTGGKTVGGIIKTNGVPGLLLFLPPPQLEDQMAGRIETLVAKAAARPNKPKDRAAKARQTVAAKKKAEHSVVSQFIAAIANLDKAARSDRQITPPPAWAEDPIWELPAAMAVEEELAKKSAVIAELQSERKGLEEKLKKSQQLSALLFEKGAPLETAILIALRLLGFKAENFTEGDSEFDAVMTDLSGLRLIGEAEGRDDKAISVDKLDQLDRNLKEDFSRQTDHGARYAHGVLFGNAYRLGPPEERSQAFTEKCMIAAERSEISLVRTPDLFQVARYLQTNGRDKVFAELCRSAIINGAGKIVEFPSVPK
jgi:hypothetical protein